MEGLTRDSEYIKKNIYKKDGKFYCKKACSIEYPQWYNEKEMGDIGDQTYFYGICIIIIDDKYSVCTIPTLCKSDPIDVSTIERGEDKFTKLYFGAEDPIMYVDVIKEVLLSYNFFNNFFIYSRIPWYIEQHDLLKCFNMLLKYGGSQVGANPITTELLVSFVTRVKNDPDIYFRHAKPTEEYGYVDLKNLYYSVKGTVDKIAGSYLQDGIVSALVKQPTNKYATDLDMHLKG